MWTAFSCAALVFAAACAGDLEPGAGNDPGTGTRTLVIEGSVRASARMINAHAPADFATEITVHVSLDGRTLTTGAITVTSSTGKFPLTLHDDGRWRGDAASYDQVYVLDVMSGEHRVDGVRVDGPDIHVFSQPTAGSTIDARESLTIEWRREDEADSAALRAPGREAAAIVDTGSYQLPAGTIRADPSVARQHLLRLWRTNRVVPRGTAGGSTWSVTVENGIDVITEAQPLPL